jgi:hypothetical protein
MTDRTKLIAGLLLIAATTIEFGPRAIGGLATTSIDLLLLL